MSMAIMQVGEIAAMRRTLAVVLILLTGFWHYFDLVVLIICT